MDPDVDDLGFIRSPRLRPKLLGVKFSSEEGDNSISFEHRPDTSSESQILAKSPKLSPRGEEAPHSPTSDHRRRAASTTTLIDAKASYLDPLHNEMLRRMKNSNLKFANSSEREVLSPMASPVSEASFVMPLSPNSRGIMVYSPDVSHFRWRPTEEQRREWMKKFEAVPQKTKGFISISRASRLFFKESQLNEDQLSIICCLADVTGDAKLDAEEFIAAEFLIDAVKKGQPIPNALPRSLLPDSDDEMDQSEDYSYLLKRTYGPTAPDRKSVMIPHGRNSVIISRGNSAESLIVEIQQSDPSILGTQMADPTDHADDVTWVRGENGEKIIMAGTVDGLIKCLASEQHIAYGHEYTDILILTHQRFTTSPEFLNRLIKIYHNPEYADPTSTWGNEEKARVVLRLRIINFIRKWMDTMHDDFKGGEMKVILDRFIQTLIESGDYMQVQCASILKEAKNYNIILPDVDRSPKPIKMKNVTKGFTFQDVPPQELARQMTIYDHSIFRQIKPMELLNQKWTEGTPSATFANRMERVTYWIATEIVSCTSLKPRVILLCYFLRLAEQLLELRNFYGLMSVYLALSLTAIERLTKTWKGVPSRFVVVWNKISDLLNPCRNFYNFRRLWAASDAPRIPPPTIFQKDLLFIEDGNADTGERGMINFEKLFMLGRCMNQIRSSQESPYNLIPVLKIQAFLINDLSPMSSQQISAMARSCEPPSESPSDTRRRTISGSIRHIFQK
ncbi:Ras guanine nucleotide exchange factor [Planoprotostelium fungivorum]|uniref:Ras guanine nucleotide exchange factor n=1 Tax=Planoprotostelium fungivorum TaxID=1890364 RepID=A0A2P6NW04_9EUKA|nr:Ras guanine nucleotide exchange factor [Planoprotostelium fungivorum]